MPKVMATAAIWFGIAAVIWAASGALTALATSDPSNAKETMILAALFAFASGGAATFVIWRKSD